MSERQHEEIERLRTANKLLRQDRDKARQDVERLRKTKPGDEDVWRLALAARLAAGDPLRGAVHDADAALGEYRKRWPR